MTFRKIDRTAWPRNEIFEHYFSTIPCTYSLTAKLDITNIRAKQLRLYPTMAHSITTVVNRHEEFRTAFDEADELGVYSELHRSRIPFKSTRAVQPGIHGNYSLSLQVSLAPDGITSQGRFTKRRLAS